MEFLGSIVESGKRLLEVGKWIRDISRPEANMQNLKRKMRDLSCREEEINAEVSSAEQQPAKRRKTHVGFWLEEVQKMKDDVQILEREVDGQRTNVLSRFLLGKRIVEKIQEVEELHEKGIFSNGLVNDALPTRGRFIPTAKNYVESARYMEKVWQHLMENEIRRIAVSGMGGVGKTTVMQRIHNRLLEETCNFDSVFWVTVSKQFNLITLQSDIAKALNFDLSDKEDETRRASELYEMLSRRKKYVLILDDLWEAFPLEKVGIPEPTSSNGCKLVLTTRSLKVSTRMECIIVKVEPLTEQEALNLFLSKAIKNNTVLAPEVKEIATKVANNCAGLPLAIVTVAGSMREVTDIREWRNALKELKEVTNGESDVFERLKFSYSRLNDEVLQQCFLYCALYPEDHTISMEELIEYWIAEGLIAEMQSVKAMFDKGHVILKQLINTCLLEKCSDFRGTEGVKMHDLVRDMALRITAHSPRFMVKAGEGQKCVPYEEWSEDVERVSLMDNEIEELPTRPPNCPQLTTLLLRNIGGSFLVIPENFFMHMPRLKVLDLSYCSIRYLPESISTLEKLHALLLSNCTKLNYVPSLEKLKALTELNLSTSKIKEVPQGIQELVNLRKLDLSSNRSLVIFPSWKLCRLSQLQLLRLDGTGLEFLADELLCLRKLKVLGAHFHNVQELTRYATSQQCQGLENYRLSVGIDGYYYPPIEGKVVHIILESEHFGSGVDQLVLPSNIEECKLSGYHNLSCLSDIVSLRYARDLIYFRVGECNGIESIFSSSFNSEDDQFPLRTVRYLFLYDLPIFRVLFDGIVPPHNITFNLKELVFHHCPNMKSIFPVELLQNFPNLECLEVIDCENVEDIIVESEMSDLGGHHQGSNTITLPNLRYLFLRLLSRLKDIYKGIMVCESLQHIYVGWCPMLRRLPLLYSVASAPPALKIIKGQQKWWELLEWDDRHTKTILEPLFHPSGFRRAGKSLVRSTFYRFGGGVRTEKMAKSSVSWSEGVSTTDSDDSDT